MRRKFFSYLLILIITSITLFGVVSVRHTKVMIDNTIIENKNEVLSRIKNRIQTFDKIMYLIELEIVRRGEEKIQNLSSELSRYDNKNEISEETLERLAQKYQIDEIYLIDKKGTVFKTTYKPDLGLNLFSLSPDFEAFLKNVFISNKISASRLTTSGKSGIINTYLYYHPKGWDCYLEISLGLKNFIKTNYSQEFYQLLIEEYFTKMISQNLYLTDLDIYQINDIGRWSLINEGKELQKDENFFVELKQKNEIVEKNGYKCTIYQLLDFERANFDWSFSQFVELSFDFSSLQKNYRRVIIFIVISGALIMTVFFTIFSYLFNRHFIKRVININEGIKRIEYEKYEVPILDRGDDELANIAKNINEMAKKVDQKIKTLSGFIPICANCKKIRDDKGYWHQVEEYFSDHSEAVFSHGLCQDCIKKLYPGISTMYDDDLEEKAE